jgi:hypothetical protein
MEKLQTHNNGHWNFDSFVNEDGNLVINIYEYKKDFETAVSRREIAVDRETMNVTLS